MRSSRPEVAVFFGGESGSHDLSTETGYWVCQFLPRTNYQITPVRITTDGKWQVPLGSLPSQGPVKKMMRQLFKAVRPLSPRRGLERLFSRPVRTMMTLLRGKGGDDGSLHGLGRTLRVPVVGSRMETCQQTSDKYACAQRVNDIAVTPLTRSYKKGQSKDKITKEVRDLFVPPLFVKPIGQESSVGVVDVDSMDELAGALNNYDNGDDFLVQQRVGGDEFNVTLFDDESGNVFVLPITKVVPQRATFYDHMAKRRAGRVALRTEKKETDPLLGEVEGIARNVYQELGCSGLVNMDMMAGEEATEVLEVNVIPTLTELSPLWQQLKVAGVPPGVLFEGEIRRSLAS